MDEIVVDFKSESKKLVEEMMEILEEVDGQYVHRFMLENYGQLVDRIMGGAKNLALIVEKPDPIEKIGKYAELCKLVGYKSSQVAEEQLFTISVALLLDATEMLRDMIIFLETDKEVDVKGLLNNTFLDRLSWVATKFDESLRASVAINKGIAPKNSQDQIDALLKQLGILN